MNSLPSHSAIKRDNVRTNQRFFRSLLVECRSGAESRRSCAVERVLESRIGTTHGLLDTGRRSGLNQCQKNA
jgi:hypothetical protein